MCSTLDYTWPHKRKCNKAFKEKKSSEILLFSLIFSSHLIDFLQNYMSNYKANENLGELPESVTFWELRFWNEWMVLVSLETFRMKLSVSNIWFRFVYRIVWYLRLVIHMYIHFTYHFKSTSFNVETNIDSHGYITLSHKNMLRKLIFLETQCFLMEDFLIIWHMYLGTILVSLLLAV